MYIDIYTCMYIYTFIHIDRLLDRNLAVCMYLLLVADCAVSALLYFLVRNAWEYHLSPASVTIDRFGFLLAWICFLVPPCMLEYVFHIG